MLLQSQVPSLPPLLNCIAQSMLPRHDSMEERDMQWWARFLDELCPAITPRALYMRLTEGEAFNQLPSSIWGKLHCSKEGLTEEESVLAEAKVQPIREAIVAQILPQLIDYLIKARLDLIAIELRIDDLPTWGPTSQPPSITNNVPTFRRSTTPRAMCR